MTCSTSARPKGLVEATTVLGRDLFPETLLMRPLNAAQAEVLGALSTLPAALVAIGDALGLVPATPVVAPHPVPPFTNSAMDGFAVRAEDVDLGPGRPDRPRRCSGRSGGHPPGRCRNRHQDHDRRPDPRRRRRGGAGRGHQPNRRHRDDQGRCSAAEPRCVQPGAMSRPAPR